MNYAITLCVYILQGMDSGFGEEDSYNVYDQPWRKTDAVSSMYRPSKNIDKDNYGDDIETLMKNSRYVQYYSFNTDLCNIFTLFVFSSSNVLFI